jgi:hypothetical protein
VQGHWLRETNINNNLSGQILVHLFHFSTLKFFFPNNTRLFCCFIIFFSYTPNYTLGLMFLFLCILLSFECFCHIIYRSYNISTCYQLFDSLFYCVGFLMFCLLLGLRQEMQAKHVRTLDLVDLSTSLQ